MDGPLGKWIKNECFLKKDRWLKSYMHLAMINISFIAHINLVYKINNHKLELVWCKKRQKIVPDQLLKDSKLILNESKLFPWSSMISLLPSRTFRGSLFPEPITSQELFFAISYCKPALIVEWWFSGLMNSIHEEHCLLFKIFHFLTLIVLILAFVSSVDIFPLPFLKWFKNSLGYNFTFNSSFLFSIWIFS